MNGDRELEVVVPVRRELPGQEIEFRAIENMVLALAVLARGLLHPEQLPERDLPCYDAAVDLREL
jgi:hypothetical protein